MNQECTGGISILTILYFSRWRPIWPPNHTKCHISAEKHDRETNFLPIYMYSWTRNAIGAFSILTVLYFSRWRPIWPPNQTKCLISAEKHDRETNFLPIYMYSWTRNMIQRQIANGTKIRPLAHTGVLQTKAFQFTTSSSGNFKG